MVRGGRDSGSGQGVKKIRILKVVFCCNRRQDGKQFQAIKKEVSDSRVSVHQPASAPTVDISDTPQESSTDVLKRQATSIIPSCRLAIYICTTQKLHVVLVFD